MADFDRSILDVTGHRPWPMPEAPWVMTQTWTDLLFAHWPVDRAMLRERVPPGFELDLFDGQGWVGIVPFQMRNVAPRGVPALPWVSSFPELNVRTYVRVADQPGVYFFSLDAGNPLVVAGARALFHLPYYLATMTVEVDDGVVRYRSERTGRETPPATFVGRFGPVGPGRVADAGSLDHFLTERYCLFTMHQSRAYRVDIHHPPWLLQPATASFERNTMAEAHGLRLPALAPLLHFSRRQDVVAWAPTVVG